MDIGERAVPAEEQASAEPIAGVCLKSLRKSKGRWGWRAEQWRRLEREGMHPWALSHCKDVAFAPSEEASEHRVLRPDLAFKWYPSGY